MTLNPVTLSSGIPAVDHPEIVSCIAHYAKPQGFCNRLHWLIFRIVNAVKEALRCFGCCASEWQATFSKICREIESELESGNYLRDPSNWEDFKRIMELDFLGFLAIENNARANGWTAADISTSTQECCLAVYKPFEDAMKVLGAQIRQRIAQAGGVIPSASSQ